MFTRQKINNEKKEAPKDSPPITLSHKIWEYYKAKLLLINGALVGAAVGLGTYIFWKTDYPILPLLTIFDTPEKSILESFVQGKGLEDGFQEADKEADIPRETLQKDLNIILFPEKSKHYAVIVGKAGCGKSTAIRKTLSSSSEPRGAVYFNCPEIPEAFSTELMKILDFVPNVDVSAGARRFLERSSKEEKPIDLSLEPKASFLVLRSNLLYSAKVYKEKFKRPAVLVIDSVDILAEKKADFLSLLQDFAKECADRGILRIVFVCTTNSSALPLLMSRSSWSRAQKPAYEVGEIPDDVAMEYLMEEGNNIPKELAKNVVSNLTGGSFTLLSDFICNYKERKISFEEMEEIMDQSTEISLKKMKIDPQSAFFQHLVANQSIKADKALNYYSKKQLQLFLRRNILAFHPNETYTFYDRHVAIWFAKNITVTSDEDEESRE
jgi:ABC-type dipeptide/oligopeptide/nickel transport system ATPase component